MRCLRFNDQETLKFPPELEFNALPVTHFSNFFDRQSEVWKLCRLISFCLPYTKRLQLTGKDTQTCRLEEVEKGEKKPEPKMAEEQTPGGASELDPEYPKISTSNTC